MIRRLLGPALLAAVIVAGGGLLEVTATAANEAWAVSVFGILGLVCAAVYGVGVWRPHERLAGRLARLERDHELQCDALSRTLDELRRGDLVAAADPSVEVPAEISDHVEGATRALAAQIQQIQTSSVEVANSATTVHETSGELASGSSQQAAAVVEITATMEQLARTAGQIATNAARQAELAGQSEISGEEGARSLEDAVTGLDVVREHMEAIANRSDVLGSRSRQIYRVLDLIKEIAQETHILSLNAAIEAAAAGEHGERFAVVAEEVRRLAERSRESIESVRGLLDEFSGAIRGVVVATEEGTKSVSQVLEQSHQTRGAVGELRRALADTAQAAREISLATQEQRTASDEVVLTLKEVSSVIQRMAEGLKQFTGAADRLSQVALTIQLLTQSFRIDSAHSLKHRIMLWAANISDYANNLEAIEGALEELLQQAPFLELLYLVDPKGVMVSYVLNYDLVPKSAIRGAVSIGSGYAERPWFLAVQREERTAITPLYESLLTGDPCFTIAAAVHGPRGRLIGILGADVNVRNWTRI